MTTQHSEQDFAVYSNSINNIDASYEELVSAIFSGYLDRTQTKGYREWISGMARSYYRRNYGVIYYRRNYGVMEPADQSILHMDPPINAHTGEPTYLSPIWVKDFIDAIRLNKFSSISEIPPEYWNDWINARIRYTGRKNYIEHLSYILAVLSGLSEAFQ